MLKLNIERSFCCSTEIEEEENAQALATMIDKIKTKGVKELYLAWNIFSLSSAGMLANTFKELPMLQVLDLSNAMLREETVTMAIGLKNSNVRLRRALFRENMMESEGARALSEYFERVDTIEEIDLSRN